MKKQFTFLLFILFIANTTIFAQKNESRRPTFTFKPASNLDIPDTIKVFIKKGPVNLLKEGERLKIVPNPDGSFNFSPSFDQPIYWMQIGFQFQKKRQRPKVLIYYAEPGDNLNIVYKKDTTTAIGPIPRMTLSFSGIGSAKYRVVESLEKVNLELKKELSADLRGEFGKTNKSFVAKAESVNYAKSSEFSRYLESITRNIQISQQRRKDTLSKYQSHLTPKVFDFFKYELASPGYEPIFASTINYLFKVSKSNYFHKILTDFYFANKDYSVPEVNDSLFQYAASYKTSKLAEIMFEGTFKSQGKGLLFRDQYETIKKIKNSDLRQNLLAHYIYQPWFQQNVTDKETQDSCIRDAIKYIQSPILQAPVKEQLVFFKGAAVPDFSFTDVNGNKTTLADLKGKVWMIDFYFYGCKGCISFAERFKKEVYPQFSNNPDFKVLSVSVDAKREHWIAALNTNSYNEKEYLNLSAGSMAWRHPFLQHYNRTSFPFVLLVDRNGKLLERMEDFSPAVIIDEINKALILIKSK
ncbi:TlpA family protein disulfide reductase [Pedobacter hiemivivus]|uniref:TlpA family protein disulfide reductase n=1 Tax=Pedobacter hiemivivus TaxID=2530454 RepID=A0A4R0MMA6_9SPHI|nr:TlpA disulfide reductase family protein [Pedobacter hiemivivus]TCC87851.1 TlpA family protein disulfide reductase [Pedobacter hiemivivus]